MYKFVKSISNKSPLIRNYYLILSLSGVAVAAVPARTFANDIKSCKVALEKNPENVAAAEPSPIEAEDGQAMVTLLSRLHKDVKPDVAASVLGERRSLMDFMNPDHEQNLAIRAPFTVMNSAQRMLALIYSQGVKTTRVGLTQETVNYYPFFSDGLPVTNGRRIIGNLEVIATFVNNLQQQASGDRSAVSIPLLIGSHGTGKSEFLTMLAVGETNLTNGINTPFAHYTFAWKDLQKIPSLLPTLMPLEVDGQKIYPEIDAPLADSPYTLFPEEVQKLLTEEATPKVQDLLGGMAPEPFRLPDPASQFIRNQILAHYTKQIGHPLSAEEIVTILNKHVIVKRKLGGRMPIISVQPKDLDIAGLFFAPNPVVRFASGYGPSHPMAWYYNGKFLTSHGNGVFMDEVLRNSPEFLNILLSAFESRVLSIGGSPDVPYDSVIISAANSANLEEVMEKATGHAAVNRFLPLRMPWPVDPQQIASLLLLQKSAELFQENLHPAEGEQVEIVKANLLDEVLPPRSSGLSFKVPDHRYKLYYGKGADRIEIAPYSIMLMSEILAASRMEIDSTKAAKVSNGKIVNSNLLRNPIDRIRLWEGQLSNVPPSELKELVHVTQLLHEGERGISSRDAGRWLSLAISAARSSQYAYTLTPSLVMKTLREMLSESPRGVMVVSNHNERLKWLGLADEVRDQLLIPRIEADISNSLANGDSVVKSAYFDLIEEMFALHNDEDANQYISPITHQEKIIDRERLNHIKKIYVQKNGRELNTSQIAIFHSQQIGSNLEPNQPLLESIAEFYAELNSRVTGLSDIAEFDRSGVGNEEVATAHSSLMAALGRLGYNEVAARDALNLVKFVRSQAKRVNP